MANRTGMSCYSKHIEKDGETQGQGATLIQASRWTIPRAALPSSIPCCCQH